MVICLDPAAPHGKKLPARSDISYFVTHPAHPPVFNDETDPEARRDFFGSGKAHQSIVSRLMQGPESDYARRGHRPQDVRPGYPLASRDRRPDDHP